MRIIRWLKLLALLAMVVPATGSGLSQATVEYIAHASFVVQSPSGVRLLIDPYNTHRWLGYHFPTSLEADAVAITHPHYDHDAGYYAGTHTPVFRDPGEYEVGDIRLVGLEGRHADPYGREFGQSNTIWMVETGGIRLAHLGDNGPLSKDLVGRLAGVDILLIPVDSTYHILKEAEVDQILREVNPKVAVPMHYQIPELYDRITDLGPIDPWLAKASGVSSGRRLVRLQTHRHHFPSPPSEAQIVVFSPSPQVRPWSDRLMAAWEKAKAAQMLMRSRDPVEQRQALAQIRSASQEAPEVIVFWWGLGLALASAGQEVEAIQALEHGLAVVGQDDWEYSMHCRDLLADLYRKTGQSEAAQRQYRLLLRDSSWLEQRDRARSFLEQVGK